MLGDITSGVLGSAGRGYGYVADDVPELTMAVVPGWRGHGIGGELLADRRQIHLVGRAVAQEGGEVGPG